MKKTAFTLLEITMINVIAGDLDVVEISCFIHIQNRTKVAEAVL